MQQENNPQIKIVSPDKKKIKKLWTVAGILGAITVLEFIIAFSMPQGIVKTSIFVLMTIVKAAYIVGEFMHLRYEAKTVIWSVLIPMIFMIWMLIAFIYEGIKMSEINFL